MKPIIITVFLIGAVFANPVSTRKGKEQIKLPTATKPADYVKYLLYFIDAI